MRVTITFDVPDDAADASTKRYGKNTSTSLKNFLAKSTLEDDLKAIGSDR